MKSVYISIVLFVIMLLSLFYSISYLNKTCNNLIKIDTNISKSINNEAWISADKFSIEFNKKWSKTSNEMSIFVDHKEMDNINNELCKLTQFIKCRNRDESLACVYTIDFFINHIKKMEKVTFQNIF